MHPCSYPPSFVHLPTPPAYPSEPGSLPEHTRRRHRGTAAAVPADRRRTAPVAVLVVPAAAAALEAGVSAPAFPVANGEAAARRTPGAFSEILEEVSVGDEHAGRVSGVVGRGVPGVCAGLGVRFSLGVGWRGETEKGRRQQKRRVHTWKKNLTFFTSGG